MARPKSIDGPPDSREKTNHKTNGKYLEGMLYGKQHNWRGASGAFRCIVEKCGVEKSSYWEDDDMMRIILERMQDKRFTAHLPAVYGDQPKQYNKESMADQMQSILHPKYP